MADELDADGDLHTPGWRDAVLAVPRHEFIPRYYLQDRQARPLRWTTHQPHDTQSTQRWLDLVYSPTTLITDLADYAVIGRWPTVRTGRSAASPPAGSAR